MIQISKKIKEARVAKHLTQQEFADLLGSCRSTVANYELGRRNPSLEELVKIADILDVDTNYLLDIKKRTDETNSKEHQLRGVIYILKNPSFPDYVKIGYADNIENRLTQLNNSECTPFAFRVYATYEVDSGLSDLKVHSIIDKLNPNLRSIDNYNGKKRIREFYAMSAEDAYLLLEAIAEIHNHTDRLKKWELSKDDIIAEEVSEEISYEHQIRSTNFSFNDYHIPIGAILVFIDDPNITCTVADTRRIEYKGETMYITPFIKMISGKNYITKGPKYLIEHFTYNGTLLKNLCDIL